MVDETQRLDSLIRIIVEQMGTHEKFVSPETKLEELQMDDLDALEICLKIEEDFEVKICDKFLSEVSEVHHFTVEHLHELINVQLQGIS